MTLGLLTVTYDEPLTVPTMLESVRDVVDGPTIALHIGEHEETADILRDWGAEVHRDEWKDFEQTYNQLFQLAKGKSDRFLILGADNNLEQQGPLPEFGDVPCYMIRYRRGPYEYRLPNLLRGDIDWSYKGAVHCVLKPDFFHERRPLDAVLFQETDVTNRRPEKTERYLPVCEQMFADHPDDPRAVFYLARTYFDLGRFEEAIEFYDRRIRMGGWEEEQWHAMYMRGVALIRLARFEEGRAALMAAYQFRPTRAEPLHAICKSMYPPDDLLFIERDVYAQ